MLLGFIESLGTDTKIEGIALSVPEQKKKNQSPSN